MPVIKRFEFERDGYGVEQCDDENDEDLERGETAQRVGGHNHRQ